MNVITSSSKRFNGVEVDSNKPEIRRHMIIDTLKKSHVVKYVDTKVPLTVDNTFSCHCESMLRLFSTGYQRASRMPVDWFEDFRDVYGYVTPQSIIGKSKIVTNDLRCELTCHAQDKSVPIHAELSEMLELDLGMLHYVARKVNHVHECGIFYLLPTNPGHHSMPQQFGGYCYINNAAILAKLINTMKSVAVIDIDYHAGNGTAECLEGSYIKFASIHMRADRDYPWQCSEAESSAYSKYIEADPETDWDTYCDKLSVAVNFLCSPGPQVLIVSLGMDTLDGDPDATEGAGMKLKPKNIALAIEYLADQCQQLILVQEGGYDLDGVKATVKELAKL